MGIRRRVMGWMSVRGGEKSSAENKKEVQVLNGNFDVEKEDKF